QANSNESAEFWQSFLAALLVVLLVGAAGYWAMRVGLRKFDRRLRSRIRAREGHHLLWLGIRLALLELAPIAAFAALGFGLAKSLYFPLRTELVAEAVLTLVCSALLVMAVGRIVLRPSLPSLRGFPMDQEVARDLYRALRRLTLWALLGHALFSNIGDLRVPHGVFEGLERLWGLVIMVMVVTPVLRYRSDIGEFIRGSGGRFSLLRRFLAQIWLPVVLLYAVSAYLVWALQVYQGSELLVRGGLLSVVILLAVQPLDLLLRQWLESLEAAEVSGPTAILQARLLRYAAVLRALLSLLLFVAVVLAIGYAWGLDLAGWVGDHLSSRFGSVAGDILFVGVICVGAWEVFDLWYLTYLGSVDESGARVQRSARSRTLLPLLRTLVLVGLAIGFLAATLSSLGLDVAPLLATAGVVGIAVGFGAQKLVQDVITGLFMLFQNTITVGDIVTLANFTGTVERITVRTLELRDLEGSLHTIPFSAVTTVTNMTRDFGQAMMDIGVAYKEDTDTVIEVLRQVGAEFETDPVFGADLLGALEVLGLNDLGPSSVVIRCRFRTRPLRQWGVRRAFLARVKHRFDELGIEIPFPQRTLHWAADAKAPTAPTAKALKEAVQPEAKA
ncbi:MAG: mechanosensitive ion channel, partial [Alphaproteobacteria bacterium]|nr:mechanosensitive ion channel [Alphaproteobacteria bacterium]